MVRYKIDLNYPNQAKDLPDPTELSIRKHPVTRGFFGLD